MDSERAYPAVLDAMRIVDRADWSLSDALVRDMPPKTPDIDGQMTHCHAWLAAQGYEVGLSTLFWKRRVAMNFPPTSRAWNAPLGVYSESTKGSKNSAEAAARMTEYMELCTGSRTRPTSQGMRRFMGKAVFRYSASAFVKYVQDAGDEVAEGVLDELAAARDKRKSDRDAAAPRTSVRHGRSAADEAHWMAGVLSGRLTNLSKVIGEDLERIPNSYRQAIWRKLEIDMQRMTLVIGVLNGKVLWDDEIKKEMEALEVRRHQVGSPGLGSLRP